MSTNRASFWLLLGFFALAVGVVQLEWDYFLQQLIDQVPPGSVIKLKPGIYHANLLITKPLTLCGEGSQQTILEGFQRGEPVMGISNAKEPIEVSLQGLALTKGQAFSFTDEGAGLDLSYPSSNYNLARVTLRDVKISDNDGHGIRAYGTAKQSQLALYDVEISKNGQGGLVMFMSEASTAILQNVIIAGNGTRGGDICPGIYMANPGSLSLQGVKIVGNRCGGIVLWEGIIIRGPIHAVLQNVQVSNNEIGISMAGSVTASLTDVEVSSSTEEGLLVGSPEAQVERSPQVEFKQVKIFSNGRSGLSVLGASTVKLQETTLEQNGVDLNCLKPQGTRHFYFSCNGLDIQDQAKVTLMDSLIRGNSDWGVAAYLVKCGYATNRFTGTLAFEGHNVIEGNNTAGNQKGETCLP